MGPTGGPPGGRETPTANLKSNVVKCSQFEGGPGPYRSLGFLKGSNRGGKTWSFPESPFGQLPERFGHRQSEKAVAVPREWPRKSIGVRQTGHFNFGRSTHFSFAQAGGSAKREKMAPAPDSNRKPSPRLSDSGRSPTTPRRTAS